MKEFNINNYVEVKLTEEGLKILEERHNSILQGMTPEAAKSFGTFKSPEVDEEGFTRFQFWELMQTFGNYMYNGNPNLPFETNIKISEEYLAEHTVENSKSK